jgi:hypothetical protein
MMSNNMGGGFGVNSGNDLNNPFQNSSILFPMVDERNKRGRPPKKPKTIEME